MGVCEASHVHRVPAQEADGGVRRERPEVPAQAAAVVSVTFRCSHLTSFRRGSSMSMAQLVGGAKELGIRFTLVSLLPTAFLVLFVLSLVRSGAVSGAPVLSDIPTNLGATQLGELALLVLFASLIVQPLQLWLVRLFEGYGWAFSRTGRVLNVIAVELQLRRLQRLDQTAFSVAGNAEEAQRQLLATAQRRTYYPRNPANLLPTRLGNALRAAEDCAGQRYGLDTNACMPRLYPHLSERLTQVLNDRRNQLDVAVRLCAVLLLATVISTPMLMGDGWWLTVPAATGLLAWVAYRGAVHAAVSYGQALYVAFDLHRFDMVRGLHYSPPPRERERAFNSELSAFLRGEIDQVSHPYAHPDTPPTPPAGRSWLRLSILRRFYALRSRSAEKSQDVDRQL